MEALGPINVHATMQKIPTKPKAHGCALSEIWCPIKFTTDSTVPMIGN